MDDRPGARLARDIRTGRDLTDSLYCQAESHAHDVSSADMRAASMPAKRLHDTKCGKRKGSADEHPPRISLGTCTDRAYWIASKSGKRGRLHLRREPSMEMHQSTCLNLSTDGNECDLWILPDFDEWEAEAESPQEVSRRREAEWAPLVERAVNSNRERLRRRLEGDGWDFVGGRYGEDGKALREMNADSEESVDEEFDVVVLPVVHVSC